MTLSIDYFRTLQELLESAEEAYATGDYDEVAEYLEEIRDTAISGLEELEDLEND